MPESRPEAFWWWSEMQPQVSGSLCWVHWDIFLPFGLPPGVWSLPPLFFITASCSASSSSHLTLSSFIPPCLTHLLFPLSFSPPCQLPGPLTPVSSPCSLSLFHQHPCLSLSLSEFSCYFSLYYTLILRVPPYQTRVVYPAAICKTSLLLQVTPSGPGQEKERLRKQRGWESREGMRLKILRLAALDTSIQISKRELPRCPSLHKDTVTKRPLHSSVFGHHTWLSGLWDLREGGRGKKPGTYKDCKKAKVKKKKKNTGTMSNSTPRHH